MIQKSEIVIGVFTIVFFLFSIVFSCWAMTQFLGLGIVATIFTILLAFPAVGDFIKIIKYFKE